MGTVITYRCPPGYKLSHDWYAPAIAKIECMNTGKFAVPADWGKCVIRK